MAGTNGRSHVERLVTGVYARLLACVLAAVCAALVISTNALASPTPFTWTGSSTSSEDWSAAENWAGKTAPSEASEISELIFPRLEQAACSERPQPEPCYFSFNNVAGLSTEAIQLDDGDHYYIGGRELALGAGGLTAAPAGGSSGVGDAALFTSMELSAAQKWSISQRGGAKHGEDAVFLVGELNGVRSLSVELSNGPFLVLFNDTNVGPLTISGANLGVKRRLENGDVFLEEAALNAEDGEPVELSHVVLQGSGAIGALSTNDAAVNVGYPGAPAEGIEAASVQLDPASQLNFEINGSGGAAHQDYSQLVSHGSVQLDSAELNVVVQPPSEGAACPTFSRGQTFTFISTTGSLGGSFSDAPEHGAEVSIEAGEGCPPTSQTIRISYNESGGTETVTGTVEAAAKEAEEAKEKAEKEQQKKHEEEAAARKRQEEEAAKGGVLASTTPVASAAELKGLLLQLLAPSGKNAKIAALLKHGGYTVSFSALTAGQLTISWYLVPKGAHLASAKPTLVARGQVTASAAGGSKVAIKLTSKGRALLEHAHEVKLTALGSITATGGVHVSATRALVLKR